MRYIDKAKPTWCKLLLQRVLNAAVLARDSEGNKSAAKMAMMAMTTNNSMSVKARRRDH
jgi:ATP-dependent Clp protease ATP-binding subunit ClpA